MGVGSREVVGKEVGGRVVGEREACGRVGEGWGNGARSAEEEGERGAGAMLGGGGRWMVVCWQACLRVCRG